MEHPIANDIDGSASGYSSHVNDQVGVDKFTGLPKLAIEFLPDCPEMEEKVENKEESRRKSVTFDPSTKMESKSPKCSPNTNHRNIMHTTSLEEGKHRRKTPILKPSRSKSVFIKLQVPRHQNASPLAHHGIHQGEYSDGSDADIHTAPVVSSDPNNSQFPFDPVIDRRPSDPTLRFPPSAFSPHSSSAIEEDEITDVVPSKPRYRSLGRRSSFLYLSDTEDDPVSGLSSKQMSRSSSIGSYAGDEYITPFAQILSKLHHVRSQFIELMGLQEDVRHLRSHPPSSPQSSPYLGRLSPDFRRQRAVETIEELDWCLKKLESVDSAKSMGMMAQDKFERILTRELSHLSESSRSGSQVAMWVQNITGWERGDRVDQVLDRGSYPVNALTRPLQMEVTLSQSMGHDEWRKKSLPSFKVQDYCERVPIFGVKNARMDTRKMKEFMEHQVDKWGLDAFHLDTISGGNPLVTASYDVFKRRKLFSEFKIFPPAFINFMTAVQSHYLLNPYHNCIHGSDVFLATNYLLKAKALKNVFTNLEVMAALVAAAIHDVGHPGRSNQFLVNIGHELAILYNDSSVLENHHLAIAFKIMQEPSCNFLGNLDADQRQVFRKMVIDMVLATDMTKHLKHLAELKTLLETKKVANEGILVLDKYKDRSEVLQCLIHCADLSNPAKPELLAAQWSKRVMEEAFLQGDEEKKRGIPMNPLGDRDQVCIEKCQVTFIDFIVYPLWETWAELVYPDAQHILENLSKTREYWNSQIPCSPPPGEVEEQSTPTERESSVGDTVFSNHEEDSEVDVEETLTPVNSQFSPPSAASANPGSHITDNPCPRNSINSKNGDASSSSAQQERRISESDVQQERKGSHGEFLGFHWQNSDACDRRSSFASMKEKSIGAPLDESER